MAFNSPFPYPDADNPAFEATVHLESISRLSP